MSECKCIVPAPSPAFLGTSVLAVRSEFVPASAFIQRRTVTQVRVSQRRSWHVRRVLASASGNNNDDKRRGAEGKPGIVFSRRSTLQVLNGLLGVATLSLLARMGNTWRYLSPRSVLASLGLQSVATRAANASEGPGDSAVRKSALDFLSRQEGRGIPCPPLPRSSDWVNSRPLSISKELKGKIVLLDFWTSCCINCQHILPKLAELEAKYGKDGTGGFAVVGVHSAKFSFERETSSVAAAVEKFNVQHPVVNDEKMELWNDIGISSWPTLALVSPTGNLLAMWSGERQEGDIDSLISACFEFYGDQIDHRPLPEAPPRSSLLRKSSDMLRYPSKLTLTPDGSTLFVADTGNHRVVKVDAASGACLASYGSGAPGFDDSIDPAKASFHSPQGLAVRGNRLWVADTENHAVRVIDLSTGGVKTVGGDGQQGFDYSAGSVGKGQRLSSPWDVELDEATETLYVAMAGIHQIWSLSIDGEDGGASSPWKIFSGTGRELEKNSSSARSAAWAQPSHLSIGSAGGSDSRLMWVADSESSSIRSVEMDPPNGSHPTRTLAGGDGLLEANLFAFGDKDGRGANARLQHPLAVCDARDGKHAFCCDSYNNKIKRISRDGQAETFAGSGKPGMGDGVGGKAQFWEPGGLAVSPDGRTLYVADTNNYAIRRVDTSSRAVTTLKLDSPPATSVATASRLVPNRRRSVFLSAALSSSQGDAELLLRLPERSHFTDGTTSRWQANVVAGDAIVSKISGGELQLDKKAGCARVALPASTFQNVPSGSTIEVESVVFYCTNDDDVCRTESDIWVLEGAVGGETFTKLEHTIGSKKSESQLRAAGTA